MAETARPQSLTSDARGARSRWQGEVDMGFRHFILSGTAIASALSMAAQAQAQAQCAAPGAAATRADKGTLIGRVLNSSTGQYLQNAEVRVEGTNIAVFTGDDGSFRIAGGPQASE